MDQKGQEKGKKQQKRDTHQSKFYGVACRQPKGLVLKTKPGGKSMKKFSMKNWKKPSATVEPAGESGGLTPC